MKFSKLVQVLVSLNFMPWLTLDLNKTIPFLFNLNREAHNLPFTFMCFSLEEWMENIICQVVPFIFSPWCELLNIVFFIF